MHTFSTGCTLLYICLVQFRWSRICVFFTWRLPLYERLIIKLSSLCLSRRSSAVSTWLRLPLWNRIPRQTNGRIHCQAAQWPSRTASKKKYDPRNEVSKDINFDKARCLKKKNKSSKITYLDRVDLANFRLIFSIGMMKVVGWMHLYYFHHLCQIIIYSQT